MKEEAYQIGRARLATLPSALLSALLSASHKQ